MSLPTGTKHGEFLCPSCGAHLRVGAGTVPAQESRPSQTTWESLPKPVKASQNSTIQGSAFWQEASQVAVQAERQRVEEPIRPAESRSSRPRTRAATSPWVGCFAVVGVLSTIGILGVVALFVIGAYFIDQQVAIVQQEFQTTARGTKKIEKQQGDTHVTGIESMWTGSGFLMTRRTFPSGVRPDLEGYVDNLRGAGNVTSSRKIQKLGFEGIRYDFEGRSISSPSHTGEVFDIGGAVLILMYLPGSEAKRVQMKSSRFTSSQERERDRPEDFFESFRRVD